MALIPEYGEKFKQQALARHYNLLLNPILMIISDIKKIFPNKQVYYAKREPRDCTGKMKFSHVYYVANFCFNYRNLKKLILDNGFENNQPLICQFMAKQNIVSSLDNTKNRWPQIPPLKPVDCDVFDGFASYIKEECEDWDIRFH